jgi:crotonobetainyl-CoA:carnitine CoA-transferase CaiB-like acyl-CoA transferase
VKVEPPGGDPFADLPANRVWDRAKRSVALDLRTEEGRDDFFTLVATADAVIEGMRPGAADALGVGYEVLHARSPSLVYISLTAYGDAGPRRDRPGYDALVSARMGIHATQAGTRAGPRFNASPVASYGTALLAVLGTVSALFERARYGTGQRVDVTMECGVLAMSSMFYRSLERASYVMAPAADADAAASTPRRMLGGLWECADGGYFLIHTGAAGAFFRAVQVFGLDDRIRPSSSPHEMTLPLEPEEVEAIDTLPALVLTKPRDHWVALLREHDVGVSPVEPPGVALVDAQAEHNGAVTRVLDPALGPIVTVGNTIMAPGASASPRPAPEPGADTVALLGEARTAARPAVGGRSSAARNEGRGIFAGVRILDFGAYFAGPYASKLLADFGADVIKVEAVGGDQMRGLDPVFVGAQAGKRGIAVDVKTDEGRALVHELVKTADAVSHNMRPGAAERMGIGYEQLRSVKPGIVYLYAPGWGSSGPKSAVQSFAPLMQAYCGPMWTAGGRGKPPTASAINEDNLNGILGGIGLALGLLEHARTGDSQYVEMPQFNSMLLGTSEVVLDQDGELIFSFEVDAEQLGYGPLCRLYRTADGWLCVTIGRDREWDRLISIPALSEIAADRRFGDAAGRAEHHHAIAAALEQAFAAMTTDAAFTALDGAGVPCEIPSGPALGPYLADRQNLAAGRLVDYEHPTFGKVRDLGPLIRFSDNTVGVQRPSPLLGEHTTEIMHELGYCDDQIVDLLARKVIRETAASSVFPTTGESANR